MTEELQNAIEALEESAQTFRRYEKLHNAKNTEEGVKKANQNAGLAMRTEQALADLKAHVDRLESQEFIKETSRALCKKQGLDFNDIITQACCQNSVIAVLEQIRQQ